MPTEKKNISEVFGAVIKELRKENDLTQEKLAELSELHTNYISLLERGKRKPTIDTVFKISSAFQILPHQLIKEVEGKVG